MPANMKPGRKIDWPPVGFAYAQAVSAPKTFNWWSLAWAVGRDNPWDLIIFNFQTEDPLEVNWYLQEHVGCKKLDGNNYTFEGANPGIVYIPPSSWRPPKKYKKGSSRRNYSSYLAKKAASILKTAASVCPLITGFGFLITAFDLFMVARCLESKQIDCFVGPEISHRDSIAEYHSADTEYTKANTMVLSREPHSGSLDNVISVVHESVHAAFDARKVKKMRVSHNEMMAAAVASIVAARLFPKEVERRLSTAAGPTAHKDHQLLFFGWALTQKLLVDLDQLRVAPNVEDPFFGTDVNPYSGLYRYVYARYFTKWNVKVINDGL